MAVALIGMMTSYALGDEYVQEGEGDSYDVLVIYPNDWVSTEVDYPLLGWFSDKNDDTQIYIKHMERGGDPLTDDEEINAMFGSIEERCNNSSSDSVQVELSCSNFQPYESKTGSVNDSPKIYEINGQHAITVRASITHTVILDVDPDPELDEEFRKGLQEPISTTMILTVTNIYDGYDVWQIHSTSKDSVFGDHYSSILETIQSFRILHPHEDTKRLESESFKLEIRENDDLVPKDVDFIFATDSLSYDEKLHHNCSNLQDIFETLGANDFRIMYATDASAQKCLVKISDELERIEELTTTNSVFIIITDKLKNKGYVELFLDDDLIQSFSFTEDELEKRIELKYAFPDYYEEYTLTAINGDYFASVLWTPLPSTSAIDKHPNLELEKTDETKSILIEEISDVSKSKEIPSWVKNNAGWWADGTIDDNSFVQGIQFLVKEGIIAVDSTSQGTEESKKIPTWIKNNAGWWANDDIDDDAFITGIEFLVKEGIIAVD